MLKLQYLSTVAIYGTYLELLGSHRDALGYHDLICVWRGLFCSRRLHALQVDVVLVFHNMFLALVVMSHIPSDSTVQACPIVT